MIRHRHCDPEDRTQCATKSFDFAQEDPKDDELVEPQPYAPIRSLRLFKSLATTKGTQIVISNADRITEGNY